jgi:hypothetical protein
MSKLLYLLTVCTMVFSINAFADETKAEEPKEECPEGQIYDSDLSICVDAPEEVPGEAPKDEAK